MGKPYALNVFAMTSINYNTQLLMMGGWTGNFISDIWKFTFANNSWEFLGNLPTARGQMAGFSVSGFRC